MSGQMKAAAGDEITVNAAATTDDNFNDTLPGASAGRANMLWQRSGTGPDSVSLQTPTSVPVILDREAIDLSVVNTTVETVVFSHSVPANAMGTDRVLNFRLIADDENQSAVSNTSTIRVKFGGTTVWQDDRVSGASTDTGAWDLNLYIANQGATNDQTGGGLIARQKVVAPTIGISGNVEATSFNAGPIVHAASAIDTTLAQIFEVTVQHSVADAAIRFTRKSAMLSLI